MFYRNYTDPEPRRQVVIFQIFSQTEMRPTVRQHSACQSPSENHFFISPRKSKGLMGERCPRELCLISAEKGDLGKYEEFIKNRHSRPRESPESLTRKNPQKHDLTGPQKWG